MATSPKYYLSLSYEKPVFQYQVPKINKEGIHEEDENGKKIYITKDFHHQGHGNLLPFEFHNLSFKAFTAKEDDKQHLFILVYGKELISNKEIVLRLYFNNSNTISFLNTLCNVPKDSLKTIFLKPYSKTYQGKEEDINGNVEMVDKTGINLEILINHNNPRYRGSWAYKAPHFNDTDKIMSLYNIACQLHNVFNNNTDLQEIPDHPAQAYNSQQPNNQVPNMGDLHTIGEDDFPDEVPF